MKMEIDNYDNQLAEGGGGGVGNNNNVHQPPPSYSKQISMESHDSNSNNNNNEEQYDNFDMMPVTVSSPQQQRPKKLKGSLQLNDLPANDDFHNSSLSMNSSFTLVAPPKPSSSNGGAIAGGLPTRRATVSSGESCSSSSASGPKKQQQQQLSLGAINEGGVTTDFHNSSLSMNSSFTLVAPKVSGAPAAGLSQQPPTHPHHTRRATVAVSSTDDYLSGAGAGDINMAPIKEGGEREKSSSIGSSSTSNSRRRCKEEKDREKKLRKSRGNNTGSGSGSNLLADDHMGEIGGDNFIQELNNGNGDGNGIRTTTKKSHSASSMDTDELPPRYKTKMSASSSYESSGSAGAGVAVGDLQSAAVHACDERGRCVYHPFIVLRKKALLG